MNFGERIPEKQKRVFSIRHLGLLEERDKCNLEVELGRKILAVKCFS